MLTLSPGDLAYVWSYFSGPLPCKVLGRNPDRTIRVRMTAQRPGYPRGEIMDEPLGDVLPRKALQTVRGTYGTRRYALPYEWKD